MKERGTLIAIDLDGDRMTAVAATLGGMGWQGGSAVVRAWRTARRPEGLDPADAAAVGSWIREELTGAGFPRGAWVMAVGRGDVVLKRLVVPGAEGLREHEVGGMVRMQMARQMTMALEGSVIDYVPFADEGGNGAAVGGAPARTILAGALPGDRLAWLRRCAEGARAKLGRIGLRAAGAAALVAGSSHRRNGAVLVVSPGARSSEFALVDAGRLVFARAADVGLPTELDDDAAREAFADRLAVEAKRTWMSYRVGQESLDVEAVVVTGDGDIADRVGRECAEALELPWEPFRFPGAISLPRDVPEGERCLVAPLVGLLAERIIAQATFDFASPRRAPDMAAARRQRVMLAVLAVIVFAGSAYVLSLRSLSALRTRVDAAEERESRLATEYEAFVLEEAKLRHIQEWLAPRVDWLAHVRWLSDQMPDPRDARLNVVQGTSEARVNFSTSDRSLGGGEWSHSRQARLRISGEVELRAVADGLRGRLIAGDLYRVDSRGSDVADGFDFTLTTAALSPLAAETRREGEAADETASPEATAPRKGGAR